MSTTKLLSIIHFNDVYDIQSKQGKGGICNFKAQVERLRKQWPQSLLLFSGDAFSPSILSNIKQGWQMVHALNQLQIDAACYGNHEFDYEPNHTIQLSQSCNFPWLLGNIRYKDTPQIILGNGRPYIIKNLNQIRIGIFGVAGDDWLGILADFYEDELIYENCITYGTKIAKYLRKIQKCNIIIALTHMRNNLDQQFAQYVQQVDLSLGGHDHIILTKNINGVIVIKSGSNFKNIGIIHIEQKKLNAIQDIKLFSGKLYNFECNILNVPKVQKIDQKLQQYVNNIMLEYKKFDRIIGWTDIILETRFTQIRTKQSNYGNFIVDLIRLFYDVNIALINSGAIRIDGLIPIGKLYYSKISNIIDDVLIVKSISGFKLIQMLEYSCSGLPGSFMGSFLLVSGLTYQYDWARSPRITKVTVAGKQLNTNINYHIAMPSYLAHGGDGYNMIKDQPTILDEVHGITILNLLLRFFKANDEIQDPSTINKLIKKDSIRNEENMPEFPPSLILNKKTSVQTNRIKQLRNRFILNEQQGTKLTSIAPKLDGRIKCITEQ